MAASPVGAQAPGTPYINFTNALQAFYAARGMWADGRPRGQLAEMLGDRAPFGAIGGIAHFVSPSQVQALVADLSENSHRGMKPAALGQHLRRLRECLVRAGEAPPQQQPRAIAHRQALSRFEPLVVPASGPARAAFVRHAFACVREVVEFQQTSAYGA